MHIGIRCSKCGVTYPKGTLHPCPKCGGILEVQYDYSKIVLSRTTLQNRSERTIWRYRELLPCSKDAEEISLGEVGHNYIKLLG